MPEAARAPRTQQQRRDETRRALLDAAVESLIEVGFARTTTLEVQRRANASRGALLDESRTLSQLIGRPTIPIADSVRQALAGTAGTAVTT